MTNELARPVVEEGRLPHEKELAFETAAGTCCVIYNFGLSSRRDFFRCPTCGCCWVKWTETSGKQLWKRPASYLASKGYAVDSRINGMFENG